MKKDKPLFFTQHQLKSMAKRGMSKAIIQLVFDTGEWREGNKPFSFEVEYKGIIVVVYEQKSQYNVCTCKLNREYTLKAETLQQQKGIDFCKAYHRVVKGIDFTEEIANIF
jgi:hypothetical protein